MKKTALPILSGILCLFLAHSSCGQELTAKEIVKLSDDLMRGDSQEGIYTMTVITTGWKRQLKLYVASKGRDKMFIRITSPAKEKGVSTLRVGDEMWNYLPQVERTIKIPPSMMLQPWMGSDFANDDLVKESSIVEDYAHAVIKTEKISDEDVYVIELIPKERAGIVWDKRVMRIRKKDFIPVQDEFYGPQGKLIKILLYSEIKNISGRMIPTYWEMISKVKPGQRTIIEVDQKVSYNKHIDEDTFSLRNLKSN